MSVEAPQVSEIEVVVLLGLVRLVGVVGAIGVDRAAGVAAGAVEQAVRGCDATRRTDPAEARRGAGRESGVPGADGHHVVAGLGDAASQNDEIVEPAGRSNSTRQVRELVEPL